MSSPGGAHTQAGRVIQTRGTLEGRSRLTAQVLNRDEVVRELQALALHQLAMGPAPVRRAAAVAVADFFQACPGGRQSGELYRRLVADSSCGPSHWHRTGFLLLCQAALQRLSPVCGPSPVGCSEPEEQASASAGIL